MVTLFLQEEESKILPESKDTFEIFDLIHKNHREKFSLTHDFFSHNYKIQSSGYVGIINLDKNYSLQIKPKTSISNIFRMLEYAYNLKSFEFLEGIVSVDSIEEIFERLAAILAKLVLDRNRKGLYRGYIQRTQSLPHLRGRVEVKPSVISLLRGSIHPTCSFEENTSDLEENEILLWTLCKLHQFDIKRDETKRVVRMAFRELTNKVSLVQFHSQDCINRFYNKLNIDYKPMHGICRFVLEHTGPTLEQGNHDFLPFILYMPGLFESFIAEWLKEKLPRKYRLKIQYHTVLDSDRRIEFKIDLVIINTDTNSACCVLDTKYKKNLESSTQDIAQVVAYATEMQTEQAFLIYPSKEIGDSNIKVGPNIQVNSLQFDLNEDLEKSGELFLNSLLNKITNN